MASRLFSAIAFLILIASFSAFGQTHFEPGFSLRGYDGCIADRLCHYHPTNSFESAFQEFAAWRGTNHNTPTDFMNFRVAFPLNYNANRPEKYPVILMLHGAGESGRIWSGNFDYETSNVLYDNNSRNLLHGGNVHQQAANRVATHPQAFPGIIIFPQASYSGSWASGWQENPTTNQEFIYEFLEWLVINRNADINRIYIHGLSNGGRGTWDTATKRPDLFAAALPMSGLPYNSDISAERLETTPIRLYQGGTDGNPSPGGAESMINKLVANGGNPQYILYPNIGHGVWNTAYGEADFWSWMLSKNKLNIYIFGGGTELCPGASNTKKLGFSYGYSSYQWKKDGVAIPGATTRYLTITAVGDYTGSYTVDFTRPNGTSGISNPVVITGPGAPITPVLSNTGSLVLRYTRDNNTSIGSIGQTETRLQAPSGYAQYEWYRNGVLQGTTTVNNAKITHGDGTSPSGVINGQNASTNAGNWTVRVLQNSGCWSNHSNIKTLVYNGGTHILPTGTSVNQSGGTTSPTLYIGNISLPQLQAQSATQMLVTWTETVPDEGFFEIWRQVGSSGAVWNMVGVVPANSTQFLDNGLTPDTGYAYAIRAMVSTSGRFSRKSATSTGNFTKTLPDNQAPTPPFNVLVTDITETSISISWSPSLDNHMVTGYEVFNGSESVANVSAPTTTYTFAGLDPGTTYILNVRGIDFSGNYSTFPQAVVATTNGTTNGLSFKYYTTTGLSGSNPGNQLQEPYTATSGPNFNFSTAIPNQIGITGNFNNGIAIATAAQNGTNDPNNFVLAFDGYVQIDVQRNYRFFTSSDDGSRLYINGVLRVNNDGAQGTTNVASDIINLPVGKHAIRVTYFENGGGNVFGVKYSWHPTNPSGNPTTDYNNNLAVAIPDNKLFLTNTTINNYYSKSSGDLTVEGTWGTNTDGSGSTPPNFTSNYQVFNIANRASTTLTNPWTVEGTSSRVVVGNNTTLNLDAALDGKVYANAGSVINLNHTTLPKLTQLHSTSTVNMNVSGTVPLAVYGNLNLTTGATTKTLPVSSTMVMGNLQVNDQVTLGGSESPDLSTLILAGNLTFQGTSSASPAIENQYSLIFDGNSAHTLNVNQTDISLAALEVEGTLTMNFNDANAHTLNVGAVDGSGGLLLRSGSTLNLGNHNLVVNGVYGINPTDDSGEINVNGGNITVATASGQTSSIYFADEANTHNVQNLTLSNSGAGQINIVGQTKLANLLSVDAGTVNMQGDFVLRSTSDAGNGTARIGPLLNGARVAGNITAERYMSGEGRIWRYISSPVKDATVAQLQQSFPITGNFTGTSTGPGLLANASMFSFSETLNPQYQPFPSVGGSNQQTLQIGKGYSPFIREETAPTTWKLTGEPNQGDIPFSLTANAGNSPTLGWNLIGNPYPAPIQWTGNLAANGSWPGAGVNAAAVIRENSNGQTAVHTYGVDWIDGIIAPGQAFWVRTTSASPALTVKETAKVTSDAAFYRIGSEENKVRVTMRSGALKDVAAVRFDVEATAAYDTEIDGIKLDNSFFNISTLTSDNKPVALNNTTQNYCEQEVKLRITNAAAGSYNLDVTGVASLISKDEVTFTDNFTQTQVTVTDGLTYPFNITADAASKADGRFTLLFRKPEVVLNQSLKTEAACEQSSPIVLVNNSQPGVTYQAFHNGVAVSEGVMSTGGSLQVLVNPALVDIGSTEVSIKAGFAGCNSYDLPMTINVQRDSLPIPIIIGEPTKLVASTENATYQWYLNGTLAPEQTGKEWLNPENGKYVVEVFKGTCLKVSDTLEYVVTSVEKPNRLYQLYPNPTRDKFIITLEEPIDFASMRVISSVGQVMIMPVSKISEYSAEVDLSEVQTGFYLLQVNGQRYKVLKE